MIERIDKLIEKNPRMDIDISCKKVNVFLGKPYVHKESLIYEMLFKACGGNYKNVQLSLYDCNIDDLEDYERPVLKKNIIVVDCFIYSYPPYIKLLAQFISECVNIRNKNQFFITTDNPYMLATLIENIKPENLNIVEIFQDEKDKPIKMEIISQDRFKYVDAFDIFFNLK